MIKQVSGQMMIMGSLSFKDATGTHTSANAHGDNTKALLGALKLAHKRADHSAASHTEGMAKCNGTTLGVELLAGNS